MDTEFWAGFLGWIFGEEEKEEGRENKFYCVSCSKEISEQEHEKFDGFCGECFGKETE